MKQTFTRAALIGVGIGLAVLAFTAFAQSPAGEGVGQLPATPNFPATGPFGPGMQPPGFDGVFGKFRSEEMDLARQAQNLVRQLGEAKGDAEKDKIKTKLNEVLEKQFDLRQKRHTSEIEALESQVKKLKELVEKRKENRKEIVSKRLDQLQREAQGLGW
jgi:hypothetical protein